MSAAGTYRVGRSDFFTPGDLQADADTLDRQVRALDATTDGNMAIPKSLWDSWFAFAGEWDDFYKQHFADNGFFGQLATAFNDSNRDALVSMETRFESYADQLAKYGAALPDGARTGPSSGSGDSLDNQIKSLGLPSLTTIGLVVGIAAGGYFLWKAKP